MAIMGALGKTTFSVSNKTINTFKNLKWDSSAQYASHDRYLLTPKIEYTGINSDTISFDMYFSAFLGVNPTREIESLSKSEVTGEVMRLVIGNKIYGSKWVITKTSKSLEYFDKKGRLLVAKVSISLLAYE